MNAPLEDPSPAQAVFFLAAFLERIPSSDESTFAVVCLAKLCERATGSRLETVIGQYLDEES